MVTTTDRCPRDGSRMYNRDDQEPKCLVCGHVDYAAPPARKSRPAHLRGDVRVLRYRGPARGLRDMTMRVRAYSPNSAVLYRAACPFCGETLEQTSSWLEDDSHHTRYRCGQRHHIEIGFQGADEWWS